MAGNKSRRYKWDSTHRLFELNAHIFWVHVSSSLLLSETNAAALVPET